MREFTVAAIRAPRDTILRPQLNDNTSGSALSRRAAYLYPSYSNSLLPINADTIRAALLAEVAKRAESHNLQPATVLNSVAQDLHIAFSAASAAACHAVSSASCTPSRRGSAPSSVSLSPRAAMTTRSFSAPIHFRFFEETMFGVTALSYCGRATSILTPGVLPGPHNAVERARTSHLGATRRTTIHLTATGRVPPLGRPPREIRPARVRPPPPRSVVASDTTDD